MTIFDRIDAVPGLVLLAYLAAAFLLSGAIIGWWVLTRAAIRWTWNIVTGARRQHRLARRRQRRREERLHSRIHRMSDDPEGGAADLDTLVLIFGALLIPPGLACAVAPVWTERVVSAVFVALGLE